ncbi:hypothetical protein [Terrabacter sp. NPDC080008]|uniref:hypothetical protein n=1 Tax=Terrabacter sp. NPDC080008 TaxID=3155176 RepID=UPI00344B0F01
MNNDTRRNARFARSSTALGAAVLVLGCLGLGACSKADSSAAPASTAGQVQQQGAGNGVVDGDTIDLVNAALQTPAADQTATNKDAKDAKADRKGWRGQLLRSLHATWVTESKAGPVTHQAIRGEVTAVSGTSVTVKAKDGFSLTWTVTGSTKVRERQNGKGATSSVGAVKVGSKALVVGVGASNPTARVLVFKAASSQPAGSPTPSATS